MIRRTMLRLALVLLASAPAVALAQGRSQEELKDRYEKKIAAEWCTSSDWISDYGAALAKSKETGRPIVAYFTRSYDP